MGNRIYVGNLSFQATTDSVRAAFAKFGEVADVHLMTDRETGQARGFGFVTLADASVVKPVDAMALSKSPLRSVRVHCK